jgi:hypothetical protein
VVVGEVGDALLELDLGVQLRVLLVEGAEAEAAEQAGRAFARPLNSRERSLAPVRHA